MKEQNGFIYLHRKILNNPYLNDKPFCRGFAWCVLLTLTNHKVGYIPVKNGQQIKLMRGDCGYSQKALADIFGWSRGKVKRFLNELENKKMIQQKIVANHTIIRVLKFNVYQNGQQTSIDIEQQKNTKIEQQKNAVNTNYFYVSKNELEKMIQQKIAETDRKTTTNNNNTIYNNNILSLSNKKKISEKEREILKKYLLNKKRKEPIADINAYIGLLIKNGDVQYNLERALKWHEKQLKKQEAINAPKAEKQEPQVSKEEREAGMQKVREAVAKIRKGIK